MARTVKMTFTLDQDEQARLRMLSVFDDLLARIPLVLAESADTELAALRRARQSGGRRTPAARTK